MYYYLVSALKKRLVLELQRIFATHPVYEKVIPYIQNKFSFKERPQFGIVVKGSSANQLVLAGDNYVGTIESHVMLAYLDKPAYPIEWIREDKNALEANGGAMPTLPGLYYIEILEDPSPKADGTMEGSYIIDPLLSVPDEPLLQFTSGIEGGAQLQHVPLEGTLRLYENNKYPLKEGRDYTVDYTSGAVTFLTRFSPRALINATYRYPVASIGPAPFQWNQSDHTTLPGCVIAFGKRARKGDKVAIEITQDRVDTAQAYGGKNELTFDIDIIARDPIQSEEMADFTMISMISDMKRRFENEGIEVLSIANSGETEDVYDETTNDMVYMASMTIQLRADWEVHLPMTVTITNVTTAPADVPVDYDRRTTATSGLKVVNSQFGLAGMPPVLPGRNEDFERIT